MKLRITNERGTGTQYSVHCGITYGNTRLVVCVFSFCLQVLVAIIDESVVYT